MLSLKYKTQQILLGSSFAITVGIASNANAETASSDLNVNAGLKEALSLTCGTALSFGITILNVTDLTSDQTATVATDGTLSGSGGDGTAGLVGSEGTVSAGQCTMSGSKASDTSAVTVKYDGETGGESGASMTLTGENAALGLDGAGGSNTLTVDSFTQSISSFDTDGEATIDIGASLTTPSTLDANSLGGYSGTVTVEVDDGV